MQSIKDLFHIKKILQALITCRFIPSGKKLLNNKASKSCFHKKRGIFYITDRILIHRENLSLQRRRCRRRLSVKLAHDEEGTSPATPMAGAVTKSRLILRTLPLKSFLNWTQLAKSTT